MATKTVEKVTDADLDAVRAALAEGRAELVRLKEAFLNGVDGVEWSAVKSQEGVVEFAEARIEQLARAQHRYQADVRLGAVNALHDEIQKHALGIGKTLAEQARAYWTARQTFLATAEDHNAKVADFTARARSLEVPASNGRPVGFARDGKMQLPRNGGGVQAGRRQLGRINGSQYLAQLDDRGDIEGVAAQLTTIDAELPEPGEQVHYRGQGGAVFSYDVDTQPSAEEIKRNGLIRLTQSEAWGEEDD